MSHGSQTVRALEEVRAVFETAWMTYERSWQSFARSRVRNRAAAHNIVVDAYIYTLRRNWNNTAWVPRDVYGAVRWKIDRNVVSYSRSRANREDRAPSLEDCPEPSTTQSPLDAATDREILAWAQDHLNPRQLEIFQLCCLGYRQHDIIAMMEASSGLSISAATMCREVARIRQAILLAFVSDGAA